MIRRSFLAALTAGLAGAEDQATLEWSGKIWDQAPHNAFTDLARFRGRLYCVFREGSAHVSADGAIRVLASRDGARWEPVARIESKIGDLRDPKICVPPNNTLMLTAAAALPAGAEARHVNLAWWSKDGRAWGEPARIGPAGRWLWRVTWHKSEAWSMGYSTTGGRTACIEAGTAEPGPTLAPRRPSAGPTRRRSGSARTERFTRWCGGRRARSGRCSG